MNAQQIKDSAIACKAALQSMLDQLAANTAGSTANPMMQAASHRNGAALKCGIAACDVLETAAQDIVDSGNGQ